MSPGDVINNTKGRDLKENVGRVLGTGGIQPAGRSAGASTENGVGVPDVVGGIDEGEGDKTAAGGGSSREAVVVVGFAFMSKKMESMSKVGSKRGTERVLVLRRFQN